MRILNPAGLGCGRLALSRGAALRQAPRVTPGRGIGTEMAEAKRITQETFDEVVQENMVEFEMDPEEAVMDAVQQFESQGVDLSHIVKMARSPVSGDSPEKKHAVLQTLDALQKAVVDCDPGLVDDLLAAFARHCRQDLSVRYLAAEKGACPAVLAALRLALEGRCSLLKALQALSALLDGQPDLLDASGQELLLRCLREHQGDAELTLAGLRCVRYAGIKHERNRQDLVKGGVLALLAGAVVGHGERADVVREACGALRVMTLDDDIRVPFGSAHEHARQIVADHGGLAILIEAAKAFTEDSSVLSEICATLARLSVRNEYCQDIVDLGGLNFIVALLADCIEHQDLVKQALSALRAIAGNDDVKDAIVNAGGTDLIILAMSRHLGNAQVCEQSCAALCMVALRKPENCRVIMEGGGALAALQAMKTHPRESGVQKQACLLIRNLVAHAQDFSRPLLEMGAERLIAEARAAHSDCDDVAKAALRDLGCHVELREPWTGQKGSLAR